MKTREEIMQLMEEKAKNLKSQKHNANIEKDLSDCNTPKYWENTSTTFLDDEVFKQLHKIRNNNTHYYYISNYGRVLVAYNSEGIFEDKINSEAELPTTYEIIPVKNGYLAKDKFKGVALNTTTDVYNFMIEAGWLDNTPDKKRAEEIVEYNVNSNDRIELHHIDNNPSNNCLDNLIWVPKSIHQTLH